MSFSDLALHPLVLNALVEGGYDQPTPVQADAIPPALDGRDVLATAQTGTGKTAAFLLPSLTRLAANPPAPRRDAATPRVLVLAPTRELARQVLQSARKYGKYLRLNTVELVGGLPYREQLRMLSRPVDIIVATPGRLLDHLERQRLNLSEVEVLILDEADRMLDMGFLDDVEKIAAACARDRQTLLFTATLDRRMAKLAEGLLQNPVRVEVAHTASAVKIEQRLHHADDLEHKRQLLNHFVNLPEVEKAIVFTATKRDADTLARDLWQAGHAAGALHGDMNQGQRNRTIEQLRTGRIRLLVATDVAARGIDIKDVTHVINFDLPRQPEDYVHRIGRTGRAGAEGVAISFAGKVDREALFRIERYTKSAMEVHVVPGLEPRRPIATGPAARPQGPRRFRPNGGPNGASNGAPGGGKWNRSGGQSQGGGQHRSGHGGGHKSAAYAGK